MAKLEEIKQAVANGTSLVAKTETLQSLIDRMDVKKRFHDILGEKSASFMSSVISAVNANSLLKVAEPKSILSSAIMAATLDLPINQQLGFSYIVPYKNNKTGVTSAQFQVGWRGFVQLAMRSGQYKTISAGEVYEGEFKSYNRITGEIELDMAGKKSDTIVGYAAFFRLINGFEKYLYMTKDEVEKHAKRYSKSFNQSFSPWSSNFLAMAIKTVIKLLLSKYGILSIQMQRAVQADQGVIIDPGTSEEEPIQVDYADAVVDDENGTAQEPINA